MSKPNNPSVILALLLATAGSANADTIRLAGFIDQDTVWTAGNTYIIAQDVLVQPGVTLTVEDNATVLIQNGLIPFSPYSSSLRATLIFKTGSRLVANHLTVSACDALGQVIDKAENGGIVFMGRYRKATKGGLTNDIFQLPSSFEAASITTHYLGSEDKYIYPIRPSRPVYEADDWDAYSFMGVGDDEWKIPVVRSYHSGQNGIDALNSFLRVNELEVRESVEDGVNLTSTQMQVASSLTVITPLPIAWDVNLFDFESDFGFSWLKIDSGASVRLFGIFGDQLWLDSPDMPPPPIVDDRYIYECCDQPLTAPASIVRF